MEVRPSIGARTQELLKGFVTKVPSKMPYVFWIYLFFYGSLFLEYQAVTSDEIINFEISREFRFFQTTVPPGNTGVIFWTLLGFFPNIALARIFFFILMATSVYLIVEAIDGDKKRSLFLFILWISMPFAFWTGKLLSPEIPLLFLISLALRLVHSRKKMAFVVIGVAISIKLSATPVIVFFLLAETRKGNIIKCLSYLFITIATFSIANAFSLKRFVYSLITNQENHFNIEKGERLKDILIGNTQSWDSVQLGSLAHFFIHPALIIFVIMVGATLRVKSTISILITLITSTLLILGSPDGFGWYWLPVVPLVFRYISDVFIMIESKSSRKQILRLALMMVPLINAVYSLNSMQVSIGEKIQHIQAIKDADQKCITTFLENREPQNVFNIADFGLEIPIVKKVDSPIIHGQFEIVKKDMKSGYILISSRLIKNEYFLKPIIENNREIVIKKQCGSIFILEIK